MKYIRSKKSANIAAAVNTETLTAISIEERQWVDDKYTIVFTNAWGQIEWRFVNKVDRDSTYEAIMNLIKPEYL